MMAVMFVMIAFVLQGCSGNSFHPRGSIKLPAEYQRVYIQGLGYDEPLEDELAAAFEERGSQVVDTPEAATAILNISDLREEKRAAAYGSDRKVREYLIFLRFNFETRTPQGKKLLRESHINIDKTQIYDSAFVLGKVEEERKIKEILRKDAARLILIRLQYGKQNQ